MQDEELRKFQLAGACRIKKISVQRQFQRANPPEWEFSERLAGPGNGARRRIEAGRLVTHEFHPRPAGVWSSKKHAGKRATVAAGGTEEGGSEPPTDMFLMRARSSAVKGSITRLVHSYLISV